LSNASASKRRLRMQKGYGYTGTAVTIPPPNIRFVLMIIISGVLAASETVVSNPKNVVEQFARMDVEGLRLTAAGWSEADALFVNSSKPAQPKFLVIIARHYAVSEAPERGKMTFCMGYEEIGRIDIGTLRFAATNGGIETRSCDMYTVVPATLPGTNAVPKQEQGAQPGWKIEGTQPTTMHITAVAAIRWVTQQRAEKADPATQRNADQTLVKLKPYR
jgi:hypothetical protein